jgi:hypothetical protein
VLLYVLPQELEKVSGPERQAEERKVKMRTIGTIRLIAELYKKSVVREPVVHACIKELLGAPGSIPTEESIEVTAPGCLHEHSMVHVTAMMRQLLLSVPLDSLHNGKAENSSSVLAQHFSHGRSPFSQWEPLVLGNVTI